MPRAPPGTRRRRPTWSTSRPRRWPSASSANAPRPPRRGRGAPRPGSPSGLRSTSTAGRGQARASARSQSPHVRRGSSGRTRHRRHRRSRGRACGRHPEHAVRSGRAPCGHLASRSRSSSRHCTGSQLATMPRVSIGTARYRCWAVVSVTTRWRGLETRRARNRRPMHRWPDVAAELGDAPGARRRRWRRWAPALAWRRRRTCTSSRRASSALARLSATTRAIGSPTKRPSRAQGRATERSGFEAPDGHEVVVGEYGVHAGRAAWASSCRSTVMAARVPPGCGRRQRAACRAPSRRRRSDPAR